MRVGDCSIPDMITTPDEGFGPVPVVEINKDFLGKRHSRLKKHKPRAALNRFSISRYVKVIESYTFAFVEIYSGRDDKRTPTIVIPAGVDTIHSYAFADTKIMNVALEIEYSERPLVFDDNSPQTVKILPNDSLCAQLTRYGEFEVDTSIPIASDVRALEGAVCSSIFYSGNPIFDCTGRTYDGKATIDNCAPGLILSRKIKLNLYREVNGVHQAVEPDLTSPLGPYGALSYYVGPAIDTLPNNFFLRSGMNIEVVLKQPTLLIASANKPLSLGHSIFRGKHYPWHLCRLCIGRTLTTHPEFKSDRLRRLAFGWAPSPDEYGFWEVQASPSSM